MEAQTYTDIHKLHKQGADQPKILAISAGPGQVYVATLPMSHGAHTIQSCRTQNRVITHTDHPDSGKQGLKWIEV